ncbi:hypothetical protein DdX_21280 [Ditylenchus destructor]|uniref:Uncharacterized protein n=1 Tax=Ditylenchus destructor TaxID=166010 RepID=A0AAD4QRG3_9BILA|nr:hypothetical protein DdX_21280 [Ditylenchus destructor]
MSIGAVELGMVHADPVAGYLRLAQTLRIYGIFGRLSTANCDHDLDYLILTILWIKDVCMDVTTFMPKKVHVCTWLLWSTIGPMCRNFAPDARS